MKLLVIFCLLFSSLVGQSDSSIYHREYVSVNSLSGQYYYHDTDSSLVDSIDFYPEYPGIQGIDKMERICADHYTYVLISKTLDGQRRTKHLWTGGRELILMIEETIDCRGEKDYLNALKNDSLLQHELATVDGTPCVTLVDLLEKDTINNRCEFHFYPLNELWKINLKIEGIHYELSNEAMKYIDNHENTPNQIKLFKSEVMDKLYYLNAWFNDGEIDYNVTWVLYDGKYVMREVWEP